MTDEEKNTVEEEKAQPKLIEMVERLEKANAESRAILEQNKELAARNLLGGRTDAGIQHEKPKEETPQEYAKRIMSGKF